MPTFLNDLPTTGRQEPKTSAEILAAYPYLEPDDISAALAYAAWRAEEIELPLAP